MYLVSRRRLSVNENTENKASFKFGLTASLPRRSFKDRPKIAILKSSTARAQFADPINDGSPTTNPCRQDGTWDSLEEIVIPPFASHLQFCEKSRHSLACSTAIAQAIQETLRGEPVPDQANADGAGGSEAGTSFNASSQNPGLPAPNRTNRTGASGRGRGGKKSRRGPPDRRRGPPQPTSATANNRSTKQPFACPFYIHDREAHPRCVKYRLNRIVDVRQHIKRKHLQPSHCPRCGILFTNDLDGTGRDQHINRRTCEIRDVHIPGVSADHLRGMENAVRVATARNDEERWFAIWVILFPSSPPPDSPYVSDGIRAQVRNAFSIYRQSDSYRKRMSGYSLAEREQMAHQDNLLINDFTPFLFQLPGFYESYGQDNNHNTEIPENPHTPPPATPGPLVNSSDPYLSSPVLLPQETIQPTLPQYDYSRSQEHDSTLAFLRNADQSLFSDTTFADFGETNDISQTGWPDATY